MGTQRIVSLFVAIALILGGVIYFRNHAASRPVLHVIAWSNYFPDNVLAEFQKKTGIAVELSIMSSNEELFAKLKAGATGFDVIQPSDYMVRQMAKLSMLTPLDHARIPHVSDIDDFYTQQPYDPGLKYSVPFTWGTTGIAINTAKVPVPAEGVSWKILLDSPDPKHTSLLDDMREVFAAVFRWHDLGINTLAIPEIEKAGKEIRRIKGHILMFTSEPKPLMLSEELTVAHIYSSDANQAHAENPKIRFFIPKEGGTLYTDNFSIPSSSKHIDEAHAFIDYFLTPENAVPILTVNHLATPSKAAKAQLPPAEASDPNIYPGPEVLKKMQFLDDLGEAAPVMSRVWTELKT